MLRAWQDPFQPSQSVASWFPLVAKGETAQCPDPGSGDTPHAAGMACYSISSLPVHSLPLGYPWAYGEDGQPRLGDGDTPRAACMVYYPSIRVRCPLVAFLLTKRDGLLRPGGGDAPPYLMLLCMVCISPVSVCDPWPTSWLWGNGHPLALVGAREMNNICKARRQGAP